MTPDLAPLTTCLSPPGSEAGARMPPGAMLRLVEALPAQLCVIGSDGRFRYANHSFVAAVGRSPAHVVGRTVAEVLGPAAAHELELHGHRALAGETVAIDGWVIDGAGHRRFLRRVVAPHPGADGSADAFSVMAVDCTEDRAADAALRLSEAIKTAAINNSRDAMIAIDDQGIVVDYNPAAAQMFGYARDQALGRPIAGLIVPPEVQADHLRGLMRAFGSKPRRCAPTAAGCPSNCPWPRWWWANGGSSPPTCATCPTAGSPRTSLPRWPGTTRSRGWATGKCCCG
jgi:two-component system NtrC family sensor kinase